MLKIKYVRIGLYVKFSSPKNQILSALYYYMLICTILHYDAY